jgi:hypothetical protein
MGDSREISLKPGRKKSPTLPGLVNTALFLVYIHIQSSHITEILSNGFANQYLIPNLLIASFLKIINNTLVL